MWKQSRLTIAVTLNKGGLVEININELDSPDHTVTPIAERSDGLRAFLGLVCFLVASELDVPPVLLVDEAERNLHYDAQADLVRVMTRELKVHKVLYTTHSPGCLPMDPGRGIRIVRRDPENPSQSLLGNNFWASEDPGFSRLLFAMGAGAAAFSAFRHAVMTEGISEMILLPSLLRAATDDKELDFYVAPGLSNLRIDRSVGSVALVTTFLVDGDESGDQRKRQLLEAGFPAHAVFQLPNGFALEDLVDRAQYLSAVNSLLNEQGHTLEEADLKPGSTVARAVDDAVKLKFGMDGGISHKIVAGRLADLESTLRLSSNGKRFLKKLRKDLESAFETAYTLN